MSRSQQKGGPCLRQPQKVEMAIGGKFTGCHRDSTGPKNRKANSDRSTPVTRSTWTSTVPQRSLATRDASSWSNKARIGTAIPSSTCSAQVRHVSAPSPTRCKSAQLDHVTCTSRCDTALHAYGSSVEVCEPRAPPTKERISDRAQNQPGATSDDTKGSRFWCNHIDCSRSFSRESDLSRHVRSKHDGIVFECPHSGCVVRRNRKDKLNRHIRQAHQNNNIGGPTFTHVVQSVPKAKKAASDESRDGKEIGLTTRQTDLPPHVQTPETLAYDTTSSLVARISLLNAQGAAAEQPQPSLAIFDMRAAAAPLRNLEMLPGGSKAQDCVHGSIRRSLSLPNKVNSQAKPLIGQCSRVRAALVQFQDAAELSSEGLITRPVSTPPSLVVSQPHHSIPQSGVHTRVSNLRHGIRPDFRGLTTPTLLELDSSSQDGDNGITSATGQRSSTSWADVVRNASKATASSINARSDTSIGDLDAPGRTKTKRRKLNKEGYKEFFICIGCNRGQQDDQFPECETTLKEYFSQLERHHERHDWFYCARCTRTFDNAEDRKAHREGQCQIKCVTETCPRYGKFPQPKCPHFNKDSDSGEAVWVELYRKYRPGEPVPCPRVLKALVSRQTTQSVTSSLRDVPSLPTTPLRREGLSPTPTADNASSGQRTSANSSTPFSPTGTRSRTLYTLANLLWCQIHTRGRPISQRIRNLYEQAMGPALREAAVHELDYPAAVLETFVQDLWHLALGESSWDEAYTELLTIAEHWLPPTTIQNGLDLSNIENNNAQVLTGPTPLHGVGQQFQGNAQTQERPRLSPANALPPYWAAPHRGLAIQDRPHDAPWAAFARADQGDGQTPVNGPRTRPGSALSPQTNACMSAAPQSYASIESGSSANSGRTSRPSNSLRESSHSTNLTSLDMGDMNSRVDSSSLGPGILGSLHRASFQGSTTSSHANYSQDSDGVVFDIDAID